MLCWFLLTTAWISHKYTYILLSLLRLLSPLPIPTPPLDHHKAARWPPCLIEQLPNSYLFHMCSCICFSAALSLCATLPFPATPTNLFSTPRQRCFCCVLTGHSKHPLPTTQEKTLHVDITRWPTPKSDWLYSLQPKMEKLYTVSKNKTWSWLWLRSWTPYCQTQT